MTPSRTDQTPTLQRITSRLRPDCDECGDEATHRFGSLVLCPDHAAPYATEDGD